MTDADELLLTQRIRSIRVLGFALLVGTLVMAGIMVGLHYLGFDGKPIIARGADDLPVITLVGLFVAVTALAMSLVLPDRLRTAATARTPPAGTTPLDARLGAYTSGLIVGMALAEGPAILGAVFFLIEGHWLSLVAVGLGVLMMIWKLPTEAAIRDWVAAPAD